MSTLRFCSFLFGLLIACSAYARADRDIVYSARYYNPLGSNRGDSHWHLYRINPDGTGRTQLTFGNENEYGPMWSPDGKSILFTRAKPNPETDWFWSRTRWLCMVDAKGGPVSRLCKLTCLPTVDPEPNYRWMPDGRTVVVADSEYPEPSSTLIDTTTRKTRRWGACVLAMSPPSGKSMYVISRAGDRIERSGTARSVAIRDLVEHPQFLDDSTIIGLNIGEQDARTVLRAVGLDGKEKKRYPLVWSSADGKRHPEMVGDITNYLAPVALLSIPGARNAIVVVDNEHNSTVGIQFGYYRVDLRTGRLSKLADGQFLAPAPDGKRFCTAPGRDLGPYGKKRDGRRRTVWVAPLQVGLMTGGNLRTIAPGTVWVVGADWRRAK